MSIGSPVQRFTGFRPAEISALLNRRVLDQHAEECAFLWTQRDRATVAANYSLKDLAKLDGRVEAHVDGLRVAGAVGWEICRDARELAAGEAFACAILAFEAEDRLWIDVALESGSDPATGRAVVSALGWISAEQAERLARDLMASQSADIRRIGIGGCAVQRVDPGAHLVDAVGDEDSRLRARALKAIGELGRDDAAGLLSEHLLDSDQQCRFWAAWSAARLGRGREGAVELLRSIAASGGSHSEQALEMAVRTMPMADAYIWQAQLKAATDTLRLAVVAAGAIGDPVYVDELIDAMRDDEVARAAGEAISMITGVDLGYASLDADAPAGFADRADEVDAEVKPDPDEALQWPSQEQVARWWAGKRSDYSPGVRYLRGKPISPGALTEALSGGNQHQRTAAALEIAIRQPSRPVFEVRARGDRQLERVKRWTL